MPDRKKIFVVGAPRSGTTMMGRILGRHDSVLVFQEVHFFTLLSNQQSNRQVPLSPDEARQFAARLLAVHFDGYLTQGDPQLYAQKAQEIVEGAPAPLTPPTVFAAFLHHETTRQGKTIPCEHSATYIFYLPEILDTYPQAYVVNMIRDPRDVVFSRKNMWRQYLHGDSEKFPLSAAMRMWAHYHPVTISIAWRSAVRLGDDFADHPRVFHLHFEHFLESPQRHLRELCDFLDLEFQPAMLRVPQIGSSSERDRSDVLGIDPKATGRWRGDNSCAADMAICQMIAKERMARHGYDLVGLQPGLPALAWAGVTWPIKAGLTVLANPNVNTLRFLLNVVKKS